MRRYLLFVLLSCLALPVSAQIDKLVLDLEAKMAKPAKLKQAIQEGKKRVSLCSLCHGRDGNSKRENVPNLAQQNARYLLQQFESSCET